MLQRQNSNPFAQSEDSYSIQCCIMRLIPLEMIVFRFLSLWFRRAADL